MIGLILAGVPHALADLPRWVLWRTETRNGKQTKVPKTARNTSASSQNPRTWAPFDTIATELQLHPDTYDGCGIALGDLPDGEHHLCGIDLDSCLDDDGSMAHWAKPFVAAVSTYCELSPSGAGLKFLFFCRAEDAREARAAFGFESNAWGCKRCMGMNSADHGPAVEIYIGPGRYISP
jgi:primase-polymerase (primpol)-like protein